MTANVNLIQDRCAWCLEHLILAPEYFPERKLSRHKGPLALEQSDSLIRFRGFTIEVEGGEEGTNCSDSTKEWLSDIFVITEGFPDLQQIPRDLQFRGLAGMAASDKKRINQMLTRTAPFSIIQAGHPAYDASVGDMAALENVHNLTLLGWSFNGRVSKIRFQLEYAETDE